MYKELNHRMEMIKAASAIATVIFITSFLFLFLVYFFKMATSSKERRYIKQQTTTLSPDFDK